jgi:hypothetical protein
MNVPRAERIRTFLEGGAWYIAEDREQTRRALVDFLASIPEEEFVSLTVDPSILLIATSSHRAGTVVPRKIALSEIPAACAHFERQFHVVHLDPKIEQYGCTELRRVVVETLSFAMAIIAGIDEGRALKVAGEAKRMAGQEGSARPV